MCSRQVRASRRRQAPLLEVANLNWGDRLAGIGLVVRKGEIVGLGGLDGQGQRELLLALFGVLRGVDASIKVIEGKPDADQQPAPGQAPVVGMALIPEDRKTEGLILPLSVRDNISLRRHRSLCARRPDKDRAEIEAVDEAFRRFRSRRAAPMSRSERFLAATSRRS